MNARDYDIITVGDMCVDLVVDLGRTEPQFGQAEQWVPGYTVEMGGSACIFACQAAKLGLRVAVLGRVGDDAFGQVAVRGLVESGVDTRHIKVEPGLKTGLGLALCRAAGDRAILTYAGSINAVYPADLTDDLLRRARHLHYCSYYLQTNLLSAVPAIFHRARSLGLTISLDTNWDPDGRWEGGLAEALALCDLFLPNDQEALAITTAAGLDDALDRLAANVPVVAVKRGELGALIAAGASRLVASVEPVAAIADTVGAGDSFDAGFVATWLVGHPLEVCAAVANACGRASTQARGGIRGQLRAADLSDVGTSPC
jgi:sugar/nucleoside kinase (ribokinase family)